MANKNNIKDPPSYPYKLIDNYIYIYQLDKYVILPVYPETLQDTLGSTFSSENVLARTAPIYTYSHSGPRTVQFNLPLHRDLMNAVNFDNIGFIEDVQGDLNHKMDPSDPTSDSDYVDTLIRYLQAMALPAFNAVNLTSNSYNSMINPPLVACKIGNNLFIKGIVDGNVSVEYSGPISKDGKYLQVTISFTIQETEPQDADTIAKQGSWRGLGKILTEGLYKPS